MLYACKKKVSLLRFTNSNFGELLVWVSLFNVFRLKKVLTRVSNNVSICENLGTQADWSQARNRDSGEHNLGLSLSSFDWT